MHPTPPTPRCAWLDGALVPWADARVPLEDRGLQFGESLYEVIAVTQGEPRLLEPHLARLRGSATLLGLEEGVPDPDTWRRLARDLVREEGIAEGLLYAQITGGTAPRRHVPDVRPRPSFWAYIRAHRFPRSAEVEAGLRAVTVADLRWERSDLKTTMLLASVLAQRQARARGAQEALFVDEDGRVREGSSSTVYAVLGGCLVTPVAGAHLLPGVTGPVVEALARDAGWSVEHRELPVDELRGADEVFLTATSRLAMPVVELDGRRVGTGGAGAVARQLAQAMRGRLRLAG